MRIVAAVTGDFIIELLSVHPEKCHRYRHAAERRSLHGHRRGSAKEVTHLSDPDGDFAAAWARNDHHFAGIMGVGLILPGIPPEQQGYLREKYGVKIVDRLTDVGDGKSAGLRQPANDYAVKYNTDC